MLSYASPADNSEPGAGGLTENSWLRNVLAGVILVATVGIAGWLVWSQLISAGRPKVIYLPKEYQGAGPIPPAPNFGPGNGRMGRGPRVAMGVQPNTTAGPPSAADIDAFFVAVRTNNFASVQGMLSNNSRLAQSQSQDKATALHITTSPEIAQLLLEFGANVDVADGVHGDPPIRWHAGDRDLKIVTLLFSHGAKFPSDIFFVCAVSMSDQTQLKAMIKADPSLMDSRSRANDILGGQATPLLVGARWDRAGVVSTLLDAGAKVDDVFAGRSGASALHLAAWNDDADMINLLLAHHASIEAMSKSPPGTPLTWAVMRGGRNAVTALLQDGAAVTPDMVDMATRGAKGTDPANLPGRPTDYSAISVLLANHLAATPATKP
jgi:ankyrin repeat protein